jgi:hypothetical protein
MAYPRKLKLYITVISKKYKLYIKLQLLKTFGWYIYESAWEQ